MLGVLRCFRWCGICHSTSHVEIKFQPAARRAIVERLPESVAAAVLEFCGAALALSPRRAGKPLFGPLAGCHGGRPGTYRIEIPMIGAGASLNVAVAGSLVLCRLAGFL